MQILRNGAREVIGVEMNGESVAQGALVKAGCEWADNAQYNFRYIHANMADVPKMDLGRFDMVIALCSLYYLDEEDIRSLTKHISTISDVFVLQANTAAHASRSDPETFKKATAEYAVETLRSNGFPNTQLIAPRGYSRPLVIGTKAT